LCYVTMLWQAPKGQYPGVTTRRRRDRFCTPVHLLPTAHTQPPSCRPFCGLFCSPFCRPFCIPFSVLSQSFLSPFSVLSPCHVQQLVQQLVLHSACECLRRRHPQLEHHRSCRQARCWVCIRVAVQPAIGSAIEVAILSTVWEPLAACVVPTVFGAGGACYV
jgi:hypothetical protein